MNLPFDREIILENTVALLRPLAISDAVNLLAVATGDKTLLQYSPMPVFTEDLLEKYIGQAVEGRQTHTRYAFIIFDKSKNRYAGSSSFLNISNVDDRLEIGATWLGPEFQRTGLNRNCKYLMMEYAFDTLGAVRVEFRTDERNAVSRKAIEKIGGRFEGILRSHTLMYDGFRRNTACYSILKLEWDEMKSGFLDNR